MTESDVDAKKRVAKQVLLELLTRFVTSNIVLWPDGSILNEVFDPGYEDLDVGARRLNDVVVNLHLAERLTAAAVLAHELGGYEWPCIPVPSALHDWLPLGVEAEPEDAAEAKGPKEVREGELAFNCAGKKLVASETPCPRCYCQITFEFKCGCGEAHQFCENCGRSTSLAPDEHVEFRGTATLGSHSFVSYRRCERGATPHRHRALLSEDRSRRPSREELLAGVPVLTPWADEQVNQLKGQLLAYLEGSAGEPSMRRRLQNPLWCANTMLDLLDEIRRRGPCP